MTPSNLIWPQSKMVASSCTEISCLNLSCRVAVSRSTDIPFFGPPIPEGAIFDKNDTFTDFLLTKGVYTVNSDL